MDLNVLLSSREIIQQAGVRAPAILRFTRGINERLRLRFLSEADNATPVRLATDIIIHFGLKESGKYEGDWLTNGARDSTSGTAWTWNASGADANTYTSKLFNNTSAINALLKTPNANLTDDVEEVAVMTVLTWRVPADDSPTAAIRLDATIENMGDTGSEADPMGTASFYDVADNAAKLALTGLPFGFMVRITGAGNRIEQYIGGSINLDASWWVRWNTVSLQVQNNTATTFTCNGVSCPTGGATTSVGWVHPDDIAFDSDGTSIPFTSQGNGPNGFQPSLATIAGPFALPFAVRPRDTVLINLGTV